MSLNEYIAKRDFSITAEPVAGVSRDKERLMFVVQKHAASHLHYDFRLELDGVLKSWAIPKGPATDPRVKHLAMMVEDHPFDYRNFEGTIPKGAYGGGTVIVWDQGTYETIEKIDGKTDQEKRLLEELASGSLKIVLHGQKLKGEFALVKTHGMGENGWLMIKHNDQYADPGDITLMDRSVLSGKTLDEMALSATGTWKDGHEVTKTVISSSDAEYAGMAEDPVPSTNSDAEQLDIGNLEVLLADAPFGAMPQNIKPMKPTLIEEPFNDSDWLFENKWDGYRAIGQVSDGMAKLQSRNDVSFAKFYPVINALQAWKLNAVIDGEIIVDLSNGKADFGALQNWKDGSDGELIYRVFDILWYEGHDLTGLPLVQRQAILSKVLPVDSSVIRQSIATPGDGKALFAEAVKNNYEGIVAKKANSRYTSDLRSREWLKIKVQHRQEVVIGGYTKNPDSAKLFSALLLGVFEAGKLRFVGKVGTGFSAGLEKELMKQFEPLVTTQKPFDISLSGVICPLSRKASGEEFTWLKPELVCEVNFAEITKEGLFRQASFKGMRIDKNAPDVILEGPVAVRRSVAAGRDQIPENDKMDAPFLSADGSAIWEASGQQVRISHAEKIYWPADNVSKGDMMNFYAGIAEYMLPYLKDRPMSLNRFPDGIDGPHFYQKDITGKAPVWARTFAHHTAAGDARNYLVGNDTATLLWMAGQGCIEINPWFSRVDSPDMPDYCVIDLDPDETNTFEQVITAAATVKKILQVLNVPSYPKTSGSTGIHIYIPLAARYSYEQSQMFARIIVGLVNRELPEFTTLERMTASRHGKMYLDFLQNRPEATIAGVYSLRPKPGATVSMPLHWDEVRPGLKMRDFTISNALARVKETGDLFSGVLGAGIDLALVIKKAQHLFNGI